MVAAREGEKNRKEEDDASGSLFRKTREAHYGSTEWQHFPRFTK
jgi:hypothetical protein